MFPRSPAPESRPSSAPMTEPQRRSVMDAAAVERTLARMSREVVERAAGTGRLVLVGIHRRGVDLAHRISDEISRSEGVRVPTGTLDITLYRDDLMVVGPRPVVGRTILPD